MAINVATKLHTTSTIAAVSHYKGHSCVNAKNKWTLTPKWWTSLSGNLTPHRKIWDFLNISGSIRGKRLKLYTHLDSAIYTFWYKNFSLGGARGAQRPLVQICDPPHISETIRARKLKFDTHLGLHTAKYTFRVWSFFRCGHLGRTAPYCESGTPLYVGNY